MTDKKILSLSDQQLMFEVMEVCHTVNNETQFLQLLLPKLRELLPHECLLYGKVTKRVMRGYTNIGFPEDYFKQTQRADGGLQCPIVRKWMRLHSTPVFYNHSAHNRPDARYDKLFSCFSDFDLRNFLVHGVMDANGLTASCYAFARVGEKWGPRSEKIVRLITPHLHAALTLRTNEKFKFPSQKNTYDGNVIAPLSSRECKILQLLAQGKSSPEVGEILGISVCTVRIHSQNIVQKLGVDNRVQAVTTGLRLGLIDFSLV